MAVSRRQLEVTALARSYGRKRQTDGESLRKIGEAWGGVTHPHVKAILDGDANVGDELETKLAELYFKGSVDDLRKAAKEHAAKNPQDLPGAAGETTTQYDALNAREAVMLTPSFKVASDKVKRAFTKRAPYTPNEKFPDFDSYMLFLIRLKRNEDLLDDTPAGAVADDLDDDDPQTGLVLLYGATSRGGGPVDTTLRMNPSAPTTKTTTKKRAKK